jgi:orotidine-5'-phosphate decarboxylase
VDEAGAAGAAGAAGEAGEVGEVGERSEHDFYTLQPGAGLRGSPRDAVWRDGRGMRLGLDGGGEAC